MLKRILILAALLVPSAALAAGEAPGKSNEGFEKVICDDIGTNQAKCNLSNVCKWDTGEGRCEPAGSAGGCYAITDQPTCDAKADCAWDTVEGRCEHP